MIDSQMQRKIPLIHGHHTKYEALCSILTNGIGKDREICLWDFSNMCKNDHEDKYGLEFAISCSCKNEDNIKCFSVLEIRWI